MATVTSDGQSFLVDGRRVWLVMGAVHYLRVPRGLWAKRLEAAREAGINCIQTDVFWNQHEPAPGSFVFEGDKDLRAFVELCGQMGFWVVLRPGPYVGAGVDFGGYPAWLLRINDEARVKTEPVAFRQANGPVMQAVGAYLKAVYEQIGDLQATQINRGKTQPPRFNTPGLPSGGYAGQGGGPILLTQVEHEWMGSNQAAGELYFTQLMRLMRDSGCSTPMINANNLVYRHPGTIDGWNVSADLAASVRQLGTVQPDQPKLVIGYQTGGVDHWGAKAGASLSDQQHLYRLAEMLSAGGMPNLSMFHGGTSLGFMGGRLIDHRDAFVTTHHQADAPLSEAGGRGAKFVATKKIATFASQFGHVFAALKPNAHASTAAMHDTDAGVSIVHQAGERGDVVFVTKGAKCKQSKADVLLPDGLTLPVYFGQDQAAWILLNADLLGQATLDLTNVRPWSFNQLADGTKELALFGPAGTDGVVVIDGMQQHFAVPKGKTPLRFEMGPIHVVVLSDPQLVHAQLTDGGITAEPAATSRKPKAPKLGAWRSAVACEWAGDAGVEWQTLDGPANVEKLHCDHGYGVYRLDLTKAPAAGGKYLAPGCGDRLHVYCGGQLAGLLGSAAGGSGHDPLAMKLGKQITVLSDTLGRYSAGGKLGEKKGLLDHLFRVKAMKLPKVSIASCEPCDPTVFNQYVVWGCMNQDRPVSRVADKLMFDVKLTVKAPVILELQNQPDHYVMYANGEPVTYGMKEGDPVTQLVLDPRRAPFRSGVNKIELRLSRPLGTIGDGKHKPADWLKLYAAEPITAGKTAWSFTPLSLPDAESDAYSASVAKPTGVPTWHRCAFDVASAEVPLFIEIAGMTKGQIYLNGHNVGRYFVATPDGKPVPPQKRYYLPEPWLKTDGFNELLIFDEHGMPADKCKLVYG